jgi:two-component system response regulator HydG
MLTTTPEVSEVQPYADEVLTGNGAAVSLLRLQVSRIAPHFRAALVTGERGTGKETVARAMHRLSGAAEGLFSRIDVGNFAQGFERVELNGLLFLYGLERLEPGLQERLSQRLKQIQRETRIVFASECDLRGMLSTGRLRQSLSSRVGALEIRLAALRDRMEDFEELASRMLLRLDAAGRFGEEAYRVLKLHSWPGNLAELWSVASSTARIQGEILPCDLPDLVTTNQSDTGGERLDRVMQRHVFEVLQRCSGNKLRAAEMLGISRSTLYRMLEAAEE